jgi:soluble lytic murein transglycosylase-like protein
MHTIQRDLHEQLRAEAIATRGRIAAAVRPLDAAKINEHPEPKGWSVGQVLEHLCLADELYEGPLAALLRRAPRDAGAAAREWKSSFIGGLIAESLIRPKPLGGPRVFRPGSTPRNGVVEELLAREMRFVQAMDDAMPFDWRALRIRSPALPSWAPKMNVGDGFRIHVVHLTRHSRQIERLVGTL